MRYHLTPMANFDSIFDDARALPPEDRIRLARMLMPEGAARNDADEIGVGERGLAAWTDSTRNEDWSEFYPTSLRKRKVG